MLIDEADSVATNTTRIDTLEATVRRMENELSAMRLMITEIHSRVIIQSQQAPTSSSSLSSQDHDMPSQSSPPTTTPMKSHKTRHSQRSPAEDDKTQHSKNHNHSRSREHSPASDKSTEPPLNTHKEQRGSNQ
jgi:hypothetical protein